MHLLLLVIVVVVVALGATVLIAGLGRRHARPRWKLSELTDPSRTDIDRCLHPRSAAMAREEAPGHWHAGAHRRHRH